MSERPDPFEILQEIHPVADRGRLELGQLPHADALLAQIIEAAPSDPRRVESPPRRWGRPRRPWAVAAGAVVASLVVTSAAAGLWWQSRSSDHRVLACYAAASTDADRYEMQIDAGDDPVAACAVLWTDGTITTSGQPESQVCSTSTGTTAVVPGDEPSACAAAGLQPFDRTGGDGATIDEQQAVDRLSARLVESFLDVCLDEPASRAAAEQALSDEGLVDWSVVLAVPFSAQRSCGAADVDAAARNDRDRGNPTSAHGGRLNAGLSGVAVRRGTPPPIHPSTNSSSEERHCVPPFLRCPACRGRHGDHLGRCCQRCTSLGSSIGDAGTRRRPGSGGRLHRAR